MPGFNRRQRLPCTRHCRPCATHCGTAIWSDWCRFASPPPVSRHLRRINEHSEDCRMARRSAARRVEELILFEDSPLEGRGFEPPVPLAKRVGLSGGTESVAEAKRAVSRASSILWGAEGSNPLPSAGESVSPMNSAAARRRRRLAGGTVRG